MKTTVKIIAALALGVSLNAVLAAEGGRLYIATQSHRPLGEICRTLQDQLGWQVSYEDAPVFDKREFEPQVMPTGATLLRLRAVPMSFDLPLPDALSTADRKPMLKAIFDAYRASGNRGGFEYIQKGDRVQVFQTVLIGEDGQPRAFQPMLDTKVSIQEGKYVLMNLVSDVLARVGRTRGIPIGLATVPFNLFLQTTVTEQANEEPARDVLERVFDEINGPRLLAGSPPVRLTWYLAAGPMGKVYYFSVGAASAETIGKPQRKPADSTSSSPISRSRTENLCAPAI
jgi:hypothetical protein